MSWPRLDDMETLRAPIEPARQPLASFPRRSWPTTTACVGSAPTWRRARCWPRTAAGSSRCRCASKTLGWWSPDPRGVIPLDGLIVSRSLRRSCRRYEVRFNTRFREVMERCGDPEPTARLDHAAVRRRLRAAAPISDGRTASRRTSTIGSSVGCTGCGSPGCSPASRCSATRPMRRRSRSSGLVDWLVESGATLLDVQWTTPHLVSIGAVDVPRATYLELLAEAITDR